MQAIECHLKRASKHFADRFYAAPEYWHYSFCLFFRGKEQSESGETAARNREVADDKVHD